KQGIVIGVVVLLLELLAIQAWGHGIGGFGGGFSGHTGMSHFGGFHGGMGGFQGSFGGFPGGFVHPGFQRGFIPPDFQGFGHFGHFQHELFFGPHHHFGGFPGGFFFSNRGLFFGRPFVPFGPPPHFGGLSRGFFLSDRSFFFGRPFVPVSPGAVVITTPFFCFPDELAFTDQALFFDHLHQVHGLPVDQAGLFCRQVLGGRLIFFCF